MRTMKTALLFALALALTLPALAHKKHHKRNRDHQEHARLSPELKASLKELHASNKQWTKENVIPTLLVWKQKFDNQLDPEDLATLNDLRSQATALREQKKELRKALSGARSIGDKETAREYKEKLENLGDKRDEIIDELMPLITEYSSQLVELHEEARPTLESWREERNRRWTEWSQKASTIARTESDKKFVEHMEHRMDGKHGRKHGKRMVVRFLLWDGVSDPEGIHGHEEAEALGKPADAAMESEVRNAFPNPADAQTSVTFSMPEASTVTITLYDALGKIVATPVSRHFAAGEHTVDIPTQSLPSGSYRYTVEIDGRTHTGTLQITH